MHTHKLELFTFFKCQLLLKSLHIGLFFWPVRMVSHILTIYLWFTIVCLLCIDFAWCPPIYRSSKWPKKAWRLSNITSVILFGTVWPNLDIIHYIMPTSHYIRASTIVYTLFYCLLLLLLSLPLSLSLSHSLSLSSSSLLLLSLSPSFSSRDIKL